VIEGFQSDLKLALLVSLPVVAIVVFIGGLWLGRRTVAPVAGLTEAAERISAAHPEERLPLPVAKDEIARLTTSSSTSDWPESSRSRPQRNPSRPALSRLQSTESPAARS
jgi:HAMP domain-containing protein